MVKLCFEDEKDSFYDEETGEIEDGKHGDGYEKPDPSKYREVFIPERRLGAIKAEYDCVVVHDFGDEYHLSEEERKEKYKFYEAFKKFSKFKHKYNKLDEFVDAVREALKCLDFVANNNGIYDPEKFKKLYFKGKIYINGLTFPQFKGREKKRISYEYLTEFILSDRDSKEILPSKHDEILDSDEKVDLESVLFDEGELQKIIREETEYELYQKELPFDPDTDEPHGSIAIELSQKESRKLIKTHPELLYKIKEIKREGRKLSKLDSYVFDLTHDDIEQIASYDKKHNYASASDMPEFKGDVMNDNDYHKYLNALKEWEETQVKQEYFGKLKTQEEINMIELKQFLERHNWNIRNIYDNKERDSKLKKIQEKEKKREKELKKQLIALENRRRRRMGEDFDTKSSKKEKGKKKKKDKSSKKKSKEVERYKHEQEETINEFLLATTSHANSIDDFEEYEDEIQDWSWDNIIR